MSQNTLSRRNFMTGIAVGGTAATLASSSCGSCGRARGYGDLSAGDACGVSRADQDALHAQGFCG